MSLFDLIYPKRCVGCGGFGSYICSKCFSYITFIDRGFCSVCQRAAIGGITHPVCKTKYEIDGIFASVAYAGVVKRLIHQFKYRPYVLDLRSFLVELFYEGIIQKELFVRLLSGKSVFVPMPLHFSRQRTRGYNQSQVLLEGFVKKLKKEKFVAEDKSASSIVVKDCLERIKKTKPQFGLSQQERLANMAGAFVLKKNFLENIKSTPVVFLVDDIVTTGATLREAAKVLKRAGAGRVYGLAFAHGQ